MILSFVNRFRGWVTFILLAAIITVLMGALYATQQQAYRTGANDPQIEATEEIANALNQDVPADAIISSENAVNLERSLSTFVIIYDKDGKVLVGSGKLGDQIPTPPSGVFDVTRARGENRFTWQPQTGVRLATVLRKADNDKGFILAARSLREVEQREQRLVIMMAVAWAVSLLLAAVLSRVLENQNNQLTVIEETNVVAVSNPSAQASSEANDDNKLDGML